MLGLPEPLFWGGAEIRKFGPLPKGWGVNCQNVDLFEEIAQIISMS